MAGPLDPKNGRDSRILPAQNGFIMFHFCSKTTENHHDLSTMWPAIENPVNQALDQAHAGGEFTYQAKVRNFTENSEKCDLSNSQRSCQNMFKTAQVELGLFPKKKHFSILSVRCGSCSGGRVRRNRKTFGFLKSFSTIGRNYLLCTYMIIIITSIISLSTLSYIFSRHISNNYHNQSVSSSYQNQIKSSSSS